MSVFINSFGTENNINHILDKLDFFNTFILYGCPGTGKSNLLNIIFNRLNSSERCIKINYNNNDLIEKLYNELNLDFKKDNLSELNLDFKKDNLSELNKIIEHEKIFFFIDTEKYNQDSSIEILINKIQKSNSKCKLFITSCNKIKFDPLTRSSIIELDIGPFNKKDAQSLIEFIVHSNSRKDISSKCIEHIADISGYYPILIKIILGSFFNTSDNIETFINNKSAEKYIKEEYFQNIWDKLNKNDKKILKYISLFFNKAYTNILENIINKNIREILEELSQIILIEHNPKKEYISIPPVICSIIRGYISKDKKIEIRKKIIDFCYKNRDIHPLRVECFYQYKKINAKEKAIDIILETNNVITRLEHWAQPIITCVKEAWSWNLEHEKYKLMRLKLHMEVIYNIPEENSIDLCDKIEDKYDRIYFKASIYRALKKYDKAIDEYKKLINIDYKPVTCIYALVQCFIEYGDLINAQYYTEKGIDIMEDLFKDEKKFNKFKYNLFMTYGMLKQIMGYIYMRKYDIEKSIKYLDEAEHYYIKSNNDFNLAGIYHAKAYALLLAGRYKESVLNYIKCIKLFKKRNYPHLKERRFEYIIDFYMEKNIKRAKKILNSFFDFLFKNKKNLTGKYYELKGKIYYREGSINEAESNFLHSLELYTKEKLYNQMNNSKLKLHICRFLVGKDNLDFNELEEHFSKNEKYAQLALLYYVHRTKYEFQLEKTIKRMNLIQKSIYEKDCTQFNILSKKKDHIKSRVIVTDNSRKAFLNIPDEELREHSKDFNIFLDYVKKEAYYKGKKINLFGKNIYEKIMRELLISPELSLNINDLYFKVWNDKDTDINRIRVNITGIKKIFGDIFHYSRDIKVYSIKKGIDLCAIVK